MSGTGDPDGGALWSGRFSKPAAPEAHLLGVSLDFDIELLEFDIVASIAHAHALSEAGLITEDECASLVKALESVPGLLAEMDEADLGSDEDVHMLVERVVTEQLGDVGAKLHAGRSRNDLVVTDFRLWSLSAAGSVIEQTQDLARELASRARDSADQVMPGLTHNRPAQVITLGYALAAHAFALLRDIERIGDWAERTSVSPLGAGAIATSTLGLDPEQTARRLGMLRSFDNALDAVSDRDFAVELLSSLSILATHASRLAADLAMWSDPRTGYAELDEAYSTGSSMMPQKRNPDVLELTRGKASRVLGDLASLAALQIGLPLGYHRDLQEDKEPVFDAVFTLGQVLPALTGCIATTSFDAVAMRRAAMDENLYATDVAEAMVSSGVPFRDAHRRTGELLKELAATDRGLRDLTDEEWAGFGVPGGRELLDPDHSVRARDMRGGPSPDSVRAQVEAIEARLGSE